MSRHCVLDRGKSSSDFTGGQTVGARPDQQTEYLETSVLTEGGERRECQTLVHISNNPDLSDVVDEVCETLMTLRHQNSTGEVR